MLEALRNTMGGWIAKIFIVLLGASFAVWGVADIFGGYGQSSIASVGETEVSNDAFRYAFQNRIRQIGRQTGQAFTLEQARQFNLHGQVLGELIGEATLDNDAADKGMGISGDAIGRGILEDPLFRDSFNTFSRSIYEQFLANSRLTEKDYVDERSRARTRRQLATSLTAGAIAPQAMQDAFHRFNNETRVVTYIVLGADSIEPIGTPDDAALTAFFEENKSSFRAPEYRRVEIIEANAAAIAALVEVVEEDIEELYQSRLISLKIPEKREIQQILFTSEEEAIAAADKIAAGTDYALIGAEKGLDDDALSLGTLAAQEILDPIVREAAFSMQEGVVSAPIAGALGHVLLRITKIDLERTPPFAEVHDRLRDELAQDLSQDAAFDLFDTVEDDRAAGLTFVEAAAKNNLPYKVIEAIDASGNDTNDSPVTGLPQISDITQVAFNTDPGVEADPIQLVDSGFIWVNVTDIIDARERTIDEVRDQLEDRWRSQQQRTRMSENATTLAERLNAGRNLQDIATSSGIEIITSDPLKRSSTNDTFDTGAISAIFATPSDGAGSALHANGADRILFRIGTVALEPSDPASEEAKELAESLALSVSEDMLGTYVRIKQEKFGVTVNQRNLDLLTGLASDQGQY